MDTLSNYSVIRDVILPDGQKVPLLDIKMMSDEEWNRKATRQAVDHYKMTFGKDPESEAAACKWHHQVIDHVIATGGEIPWNHQ
ncbi:MAG: hypothetical protein LUD14_06545 [Clostridiales bacterium]|nr:hypothetical protein [Clostridiales bacterium]